MPGRITGRALALVPTVWVLTAPALAPLPYADLPVGGGGALAGPGHGVLRAEARSTRRICEIREAGRFHPRLEDGTYVYVEPQALVPVEGGGYLLAGQPTYRTSIDEAGFGTMVADSSLLGVLGALSDAPVRAFGPPAVPGGVGWVRAGAEDVVSGAVPFLIEGAEGRDGAPSGLWHTEFRTRPGRRPRWTELEPFAMSLQAGARGSEAAAAVVPRLQSISAASEALSTPGGSLTFVLPVGRGARGIDALLFSRNGDAREWTRTVVWSEWLDEVALGSAPDGTSVLAVTGLVPELGPGLRSIRSLPLGADAAEARAHQVGLPGDHLLRPTFARVPGRLDLGWIRAPAVGPWSAWVRPGVEQGGGGSPLRIDRAAYGLVGVDRDDDTTLWITRHMGEEEAARAVLRITLVNRAGVFAFAEIPDPFTGPYAAVTLPSGDLVLVGPEALFHPTHPFVRSLVLQLSIDCSQVPAADPIQVPSSPLTWRHDASAPIPTHLVPPRPRPLRSRVYRRRAGPPDTWRHSRGPGARPAGAPVGSVPHDGLRQRNPAGA